VSVRVAPMSSTMIWWVRIEACSASHHWARLLQSFGHSGQFDQLADEVDPHLYEVAHVMDSGE